MTLPLSPRRNDYTGTALLATYAYSFKIFSDDDLLLMVADTDGIEAAALVKNVDYTVAGVGASGGGSITLISAGQAWLTGGYLKTNYHLTILGKRSNLQDTSIRNQGPYFPNVIEDTLDKIIVLVQQLAEKANRAITFQKTSTQSGIEIKATLAGNAGKLLKCNATEDGLGFSSVTDTQLTNYAAAAAASATAAANSATASAASQAAALLSQTASAASAAAAAVSAAAAAASAASTGTDYKEVVVGVYGGGDTTFTLAHSPTSDAVLDVVLGAVPQYPTDYGLAANVVRFVGQNLGGTSALFKYRY